jgi:hypothetical protein
VYKNAVRNSRGNQFNRCNARIFNSTQVLKIHRILECGGGEVQNSARILSAIEHFDYFLLSWRGNFIRRAEF